MRRLFSRLCMKPDQFRLGLSTSAFVTHLRFFLFLAGLELSLNRLFLPLCRQALGLVRPDGFLAECDFIQPLKLNGKRDFHGIVFLFLSLWSLCTCLISCPPWLTLWHFCWMRTAVAANLALAASTDSIVGFSLGGESLSGFFPLTNLSCLEYEMKDIQQIIIQGRFFKST